MNFSREFFTFLLDHHRSACDLLDWIQQNEKVLMKLTQGNGPMKITSTEIKTYGEILKRILREKISCVRYFHDTA